MMAPFSPAQGFQYLQRLGWSAPAAAGILGNLQHESNFNPTAVHDSGTGFGMAGWRDPSPGQGRKTGLLEFARRNGKDAADPYLQLSYLDHELRTSEAKTGDLLRTARTPTEAATAFLGFERPAGWSSGGDPTKASGYGNRVKYAEQIAGGQGVDTMYGGAGTDTMAAAPAQSTGGNGMAGRGLLSVDFSPEEIGGLLGNGGPPASFMERAAPILGGIGDALIAAGSGNPNWGAVGSRGIERGQARAKEGRREKALESLSQRNPQLGALFALGGPEMVGKVLAQQMMPGDPQGLMNVQGRVFDPNTRQWVTEAPAPEAPEAIKRLQALGIDPSSLSSEQKMQLGGISQPDQPELARKLQALGVDPSTLTPEQKQQLLGITPQKPEVRELNGRLVAVDQSGARDITPEGLPSGARPMTPDERASYKVPDGVGAYVDANGKPGTLGGGGTNVNVNTAGETQFAKTAGEMQAKGFADLGGQLPQIAQRELQIAQLGNLVQQMPQGAGASSAAWLDNVGRTLGLSSGQLADQAQAMEAIANQIVPTLRMAGSGTMSDRDVELFKSTLPQLSNTPGANQKIMSILSRSVAAQRQISEIANRALAGEIAPADANAQIGNIQILTDDERQQLSGLASGQKATQPAAAPAAQAQPNQTSQAPAFEQMDAQTLNSWVAGNNIRGLPDADYQRLLKRAQELEGK